MPVHATINLYNDYPTLPLCLNSLAPHVDSIIVCDGAYQKYYEVMLQDKNFEDAKPWSTDGSLEILKVIPKLPPIKLIECPDGKPWVNQCEKRTALVDAIPPGDWFIVIDSDEMLYGDPEYALNGIMNSGCIAGSFPIYNPGLDVGNMRPYWHPRVFLKLPGMHYSRKHWLLRDEHQRVIENEYPVHWTDEMVLTHLKVFRHGSRLNPHLGYMHMMSIDGWLEPKSSKGHFNIE